jgi:hypothetical protein
MSGTSGSLEGTDRRYGGNMAAVRQTDLDLGWDPAGPLIFLLMQPRYEVVAAAHSEGLITGGFRQKQEATIKLVAKFIGHWPNLVPGDYPHVHAAILPEFSVPVSSANQLLDSLASAHGGFMLVAGIERQSVQEYLQLVEARVTDGKWIQYEKEVLSGYEGSDTAWVNAMLIAWRKPDGAVGMTTQRKITPSPWEQESLCCGDTLNVFSVDKKARFAFTICSDMFSTPPPHTIMACPVAEDFISQCESGVLHGLDAIIHLQYNRSPDHRLIEDGFGALLVRSADRVSNDLRGAMVIRVNCAGHSEEDDAFGLSGLLVGGHEQYRRETPTCCRKRGGEIVRYDMRPRRGSAFLVELHLPSRTSSTWRTAGVHPIMRGRWLGLRDALDSLDFREGGPAANPEPYRFAAWRAFRCSCDDILIPAGGNPRRKELRAHLKAKYRELRSALWRPNGDYLERWGRDAARWDSSRVGIPDEWNSEDVGQLRKLVTSLTMVHAGVGLQPAPRDTPTATIGPMSGAHSLHSRVARCAFDDVVGSRVPEEFADRPSNAGSADLYLVSSTVGPSLKAERVKVTGLTRRGAPTNAEPGEVHLLTETWVTVVAVEAVERAVLGAKDIGPDDLPALIGAVLTAEEAEQEGG